MDGKQSAFEHMACVDRAIGILRRFDQAKNKRAQFLTIWQEVADLVLPARGGFIISKLTLIR